MSVKYPIEDVLTVLTGRLLCEMDNLYSILRYMCQDRISIALVPDAVDHCRPHILAQYPDLAPFERADIPVEEIDAFLDRARATFGDALPLDPAPWEPRDPIQEMIDRFGADRVIGVVAPSDDA